MASATVKPTITETGSADKVMLFREQRMLSPLTNVRNQKAYLKPPASFEYKRIMRALKIHARAF